MKILQSLFIILSLMTLSLSQVSADYFIDEYGSDGAPDIRYCRGDDCGLENGIDIIKDSLDDIETERGAAEYIQDVVGYLLTFISIVAVIYIIYAGFQILIGNGDEEKMKKSRQTIIFVIIGIVVIWLAWPITKLILQVLGYNPS